MNVIGIDFGNDACYVAVARAGGIETIANEYSLRSTPSFVGFNDKSRIFGVDASNQLITNLRNTIFGFKRFLGRMYDDPYVLEESKSIPFKLKPMKNGRVGILVKYLEEETVFSPEQIAAMLLSKLKENAENVLGSKVVDCVISVPSFFTNAERKALLDAGAIAGLNVLKLMNETTAAALTYGMYKQDLPNLEENPRNVIFVDCGQAALQVFICAYNKGKLKMLSSASDYYLGGRDYDRLLALHFKMDFESRYGIDLGNIKDYMRILKEVEKLKKRMSANTTVLPIDLECLANKDVHGEMCRAEFEALCTPLFQRIESTLKSCLDNSKLKIDDIHSVELIGGSSRIPKIKRVIEAAIGKPCCTSLNQDEAVARGCAIQCAILSPTVRIRDFSLTDIQNYSIKITCDDSMNEELEIFSQKDNVPYCKMVTFNRKEPFSLKAYYSSAIPYSSPLIGAYTIKDLKPAADGGNQKVKVKMRINTHGMFAITSASYSEKSEENEVDKQKLSENTSATNSNLEENKEVMNENDSQSVTEQKSVAIKKKSKSIDLTIESSTHGYSQEELERFIENELSMIASDRQEKERINAKNAVEEYLYELRNKIGHNGVFFSYITDTNRHKLKSELDSTEQWLYEDGCECPKQIYNDKLKFLKNLGDPIRERYQEFKDQARAIEEFSCSLEKARNCINDLHSTEEKLSHIGENDIKTLHQTYEENCFWLQEIKTKLSNCEKFHNPPTPLSNIIERRINFDSIVDSILNKPKPKIDQSNEKKEELKNGQGDENQPSNVCPQSDKMDVDEVVA